MKNPCPICEKRKPERFCPAKGEKICAVCCGQEREVTIDCPSHCSYLQAAHRYERDHRKPENSPEPPFPDVEFSVYLVHERQDFIAGLGSTVLGFIAENQAIHDGDLFAAVQALAETHRTLSSGIYFERAPEASLPRGLYNKLAEFLTTYEQENAHIGRLRLKETEIFHLLVFFLRIGHHETNGKPLSRAFVGFLQAQFPPPTDRAEQASRIVLP